MRDNSTLYRTNIANNVAKENNVQQATTTSSQQQQQQQASSTSSKFASVNNTPEKVAKRNEILSGIDETVLRQMADLGFNSATVIDSLASGKHNQVTTAYQLLVTRKKKIQAAKKKRQDDMLHRQNIEKKAKEEKNC